MSAMSLSAARPPEALSGAGPGSHRPRRGRDDKSIRIAVDTTPLLGQPTGVGVMTRELVNRLADAEDLTVTGYVASWRARDRYRSVLPTGIDPYRLRWPARLCHQAWQRVERPRLPSRFDVVHGTNFVLPPAHGTAGLVTVHDLTAWRFPKMVDRYSAAYPVLVERALARGASVHCVSHSVAAEVVDVLGLSGDRVHVIPNGFARGHTGNSERTRDMIAGPYLLAIGTVEPRKDYVGLVESMTEVWNHYPELRLVIAGADGWGTEELANAAERVGAGDRLIRLGYVSEQEKADLLAGAELFVFPSVYEGFGLPVLEAMDAGLPVVTTSTGALPEVAGDAALLVTPRSADELSRAILLALADDDLRRTLVASGRRRVQDFSWDRMAAEMADLYRQLAANH